MQLTPEQEALKARAAVALVDQWDTTPAFIQALRPLKVAVMEDDTDAHEAADLLFQPYLEGVRWADHPVKVVNGRKVWNTLAHVARYGILLARTDPDRSKAYRGLEPANQYNVDYSILGGTRVEPLLRAIRLGMAGAGMTVESALKGYTFGFWALIGSGVVLFLIAPLINKLMHGVK